MLSKKLGTKGLAAGLGPQTSEPGHGPRQSDHGPGLSLLGSAASLRLSEPRGPSTSYLTSETTWETGKACSENPNSHHPVHRKEESKGTGVKGLRRNLIITRGMRNGLNQSIH